MGLRASHKGQTADLIVATPRFQSPMSSTEATHRPRDSEQDGRVEQYFFSQVSGLNYTAAVVLKPEGPQLLTVNEREGVVCGVNLTSRTLMASFNMK